jgi:transposase
MDISVLGIDTAKDVFELCGMNHVGRVVYRRRVRRKEFLRGLSEIPGTRVVMEASGGSHFWGRELAKLGHRVDLIAPQFVKPYVKGNKTDRADAEAICQAARRDGMRFVAVKSVGQQEIQFLHRVRSRYVRQRTALSNEVRGFLREYGIILNCGIAQVRRLPELLEQNDEKLSALSRELFEALYEEFVAVDAQVNKYDRKLKKLALGHPVCRRLMQADGIGPITATAVVSSVGDVQEFKNGRGFSAWVGLVPRQNSSGDRIRLGRISKRGDGYLRQLLVHGARSVVLHSRHRSDKRSIWIQELIKRAGFNKTVVAVANKNARIVWALMAKDQPYRPDLAAA